MARREVVVMTDDLDGTETAVRTVKFSFEGAHYELDLGEHNHRLLASLFEPYIAAGRKLNRVGAQVMTRTVVRPTGRAYNDAVRAWLKANGYSAEISDRGRIAGRLLAAYESRTPKK